MVGKTVCEKTSLLPRSCVVSGHLAAVGVSLLTCASPATGKGSVDPWVKMGGAGDPVRSLETVGSAYSWVMSRLIPPRADASRIRTRNAAQVMAALRNTATNLARLDGYDNIAAAQRAAAWHPTAITDALNAA
jgi:hypothetical protein